MFKFLFHSLRPEDPLIEPKISRATLRNSLSPGPPPLPVNLRPMSWIPPPPPGPPPPTFIARSSLKPLMTSFHQNIFDNDIYKQMSEHYELKKEGKTNSLFI